jgi:hypothetical protein
MLSDGLLIEADKILRLLSKNERLNINDLLVLDPSIKSHSYLVWVFNRNGLVDYIREQDITYVRLTQKGLKYTSQIKESPITVTPVPFSKAANFYLRPVPVRPPRRVVVNLGMRNF